jgi:SAM-dependent methyltransferase
VPLATVRRLVRKRPLLHALEVREVIQHALEFQKTLDRAKAKTAAPEPGWYPWDSFGTITLLDRLLTGRRRFFAPLIGRDPVIDIGCGDGALSFLFESLGFRVCAVDHPDANYNRMRGVHALKKALASPLRISAIDVDRDPRLPVERCGLALLFGVLYHLKNPLGVLEALAARARYCLLSTAVTRFAPGAPADVSSLPVAFLAGRDGLRGDETNYWIFTETGLRTLLDRAGWDVCDWLAVRDTESVLWETQTDERVFCLLRSRAIPHDAQTQLADGWHVLENGAWRWTMRRFSIAVAPGHRTLRLKVTIPATLTPPVTLTGNGVTHTLPKPGDYDCDFPLTPSPEEQLIHFEVDHALDPDPVDNRERALIVREVGSSGHMIR